MGRFLYTVGHSTRAVEDFQSLLEHFGIELLVDVRTVPRSRHVPHFNSDRLARALASKTIGYRHMKNLGGLRKPLKDSINPGWRNASFRGFADYMQTAEFQKGLVELMNLAAQGKAALMCAEAVPWRCHRSLIADALVIRGWEVRHILSPANPELHQLTPFALVENGRLTYPGGGRQSGRPA